MTDPSSLGASTPEQEKLRKALAKHDDDLRATSGKYENQKRQHASSTLSVEDVSVLVAALAASPSPPETQEPINELLELLWEMRSKREGSTNAFYLMADRAFILADRCATPLAPPVTCAWREIESAPKDTWVTVYLPYRHIGSAYYTGQNWWSEIDKQPCFPTFWQPLPDPPLSLSSGGTPKGDSK